MQADESAFGALMAEIDQWSDEFDDVATHEFDDVTVERTAPNVEWVASLHCMREGRVCSTVTMRGSYQDCLKSLTADANEHAYHFRDTTYRIWLQGPAPLYQQEILPIEVQRDPKPIWTGERWVMSE